jgi:hypothetical protein
LRDKSKVAAMLTIGRTASMLLCVLAAGCGTHAVRAEYYGKYEFSRAERATIQRIADKAAADVRRHLQALPERISLRVESGKEVIEEIGATAAAIPPDWVRWTVDPTRPEGVRALANTQLRAALFHEFHHLVRGTAVLPETLMDHVITEGMATAFERDFAGARPPWASYPANVSNWVDELLVVGPTAKNSGWLFKHPDGRRWVGFKAGTYLIDRAMKESARNSADLVLVSTRDILKLAKSPIVE